MRREEEEGFECIKRTECTWILEIPDRLYSENYLEIHGESDLNRTVVMLDL